MVAVLPGRAKGMQTFSTVAVPDFHWERVTCARAGCNRYQQGWRVLIDETLTQGKRRAAYIRTKTNRRGWSEHADESGVTVFEFPAGTPCFQDARDRLAQTVFGCGPHRRQIRHALHIVGEGNAQQVSAEIAKRGRPANVIREHRPQDWLEHLHESYERDTAIGALTRK